MCCLTYVYGCGIVVVWSNCTILYMRRYGSTSEALNPDWYYIWVVKAPLSERISIGYWARAYNGWYPESCYLDGAAQCSHSGDIHMIGKLDECREVDLWYHSGCMVIGRGRCFVNKKIAVAWRVSASSNGLNDRSDRTRTSRFELDFASSPSKWCLKVRNCISISRKIEEVLAELITARYETIDVSSIGRKFRIKKIQSLWL